MTNQTLASSSPTLLSFPSGNTSKYTLKNYTLTKHTRNPSPSTQKPLNRHCPTPQTAQGAWVAEKAQPVSEMAITWVAPAGAGRGWARGWGVVFLERAGWIGKSSHALWRRCLLKHYVSGRCQRQTSSRFLPEHVWVCLLLEKGYERAAAEGGWFLAGNVVQIRPSGVKKGKFAMSRREVLLV